eukprot:m.224568 g.224568  ORF g.224568 m.224568 type:complete len:791 (+) comp16500_c0_seq1:116-2488(+)
MAGSSDVFQPTGSAIAQLLIQIMVVHGISLVMTKLFSYIKQPSVIAQVITGIVLGPTVLGYIPNFSQRLFPDSSMAIFSTLADFGLVWFMFIIGLEVNIEIMRANFKHCVFISITGVVTPFMLGVGLAYYLIDEGFKSDEANPAHFAMFIGVAMSITAFPVLARIIGERSLLGTSLGLLVLGSAAVDDFCAWIILALIVALVRAGSGLNALYIFLTMIGFFIFMAKLVAPFFQRICTKKNEHNNLVFLLILLFVLASAWFTEAIGVHAIFGGFIFGLAVPRQHDWNIRVAHKVEDYVVTLLLPIYFAKSGLRTQLGLLTTALDWGSCILVITTAFAGKIIPGTLTARIVGRTWKESFVVGFLSNAKGLVELIVLNLGLDLGVISLKVFGMLVLMAVVTTISATPLMYLVYPPKKILADDRKRWKQNNEAEAAHALHDVVSGSSVHSGKSSAAVSVAKAPSAADERKTIFVCYSDEPEALNILPIATLVNPIRTHPLQLARLHQVTDRPSTFMDTSAYHTDGAPVASPQVPPLVRLRARLLGQRCATTTLATPWYTDASEQIIAATTATDTSALVLLPGAFPDCNAVTHKVLREGTVGVVGIVNVNEEFDLEDGQPIRRVFIAYNEDTPDKQLLAVLLNFLRLASERCAAVSFFTSTVASTNMVDELTDIRHLPFVTVSVANVADEAEFLVAARQACATPADDKAFHVVLHGTVDRGQHALPADPEADTWACPSVNLVAMPAPLRAVPLAETTQLSSSRPIVEEEVATPLTAASPVKYLTNQQGRVLTSTV